MAVDPKEPERGIFTAFFSIPSSCACSATINSTRGNELTTSTSTNSPFFGMCESYINKRFHKYTHLIYRKRIYKKKRPSS